MKAITSEQTSRSGVYPPVRTAHGAWGYLLMLSCLSCIPLEAANAPLKPADLFATSKVWTVRLQFTAEQWEAMEPQDSRDGGMPGPGGMRFRGPGGPGGPGGFGPGNFL